MEVISIETLIINECLLKLVVACLMFLKNSGLPRGWNDHVHVLDTETFTWSQPITTVIIHLVSVNQVTALKKYVQCALSLVAHSENKLDFARPGFTALIGVELEEGADEMALSVPSNPDGVWCVSLVC